MCMEQTNSMTAEQKLCKMMLMLKKIRPFYSAVYQVMKKEESEEIGTAGVNLDTFVYNPKFIEKMDIDELLFVMLHEVAHIALMHVARRDNRDAYLWNVACDLYVNAMLANEFGIDLNFKNANIDGMEIKMPDDILYSDSIDVDKDASEKLYDQLYSQGKKNGYFGNNNSNKDDGSEYSFSVQGSKNNNAYSFSIQKGLNAGDLLDANGISEQAKKESIAKKLVQDAIVRDEMSSSKGNGCGNTPGSLILKAKNALKSKLDWKRLLKSYLIAKTSKDSSYARPDKRMSYMDAIYPGQVSYDNYSLEAVKVCIDTSGSISEVDLSYFFGQVLALTKTFKVDAELIYWDANIQSMGSFSDYKEFDRVECSGGGGTDPECLFKYFNTRQCKVKPIVTLIFTDGYFDVEALNKREYLRKYKDTIWIMTNDHDTEFNPPFGRVAYAKFPNSSK